MTGGAAAESARGEPGAPVLQRDVDLLQVGLGEDFVTLQTAPIVCQSLISNSGINCVVLNHYDYRGV